MHTFPECGSILGQSSSECIDEPVSVIHLRMKSFVCR